jgi:polyisoprenoid-binding protein YceI
VPGWARNQPGPASTRISPAFIRRENKQTIEGMTTTTTTSLPLRSGRWAVDQAHSSIDFTVRHLGISKVRGRFATFDATVDVGDSLEETAVVATIDLASIDTGNADRDAHVLTDEFIHVERRPTLTFRSHRVVEVGDRHRLEGEVTVGDTTRPIAMDFEFGGIQDFPVGPRHAGFEATGEIRRRDFGIALGVPNAGLGDVIKFQVDLELLEPADADSE